MLTRKAEEMAKLHQQASEKVDLQSSHIEDTQEELFEMKTQYEREISELQ